MRQSWKLCLSTCHIRSRHHTITTRNHAASDASTPSCRAYWAILERKSAERRCRSPSSESEEEDDERRVPEEEGDIAFAGEQEFLRAASHEDEEEEQGNKVQKTAKMSLSLKNVNISKEGKVIISGKEELGGTEMQGAFSSRRSLPL